MLLLESDEKSLSDAGKAVDEVKLDLHNQRVIRADIDRTLPHLGERNHVPRMCSLQFACGAAPCANVPGLLQCVHSAVFQQDKVKVAMECLLTRYCKEQACVPL